jgi:CheY-like chemotaxis protein
MSIGDDTTTKAKILVSDDDLNVRLLTRQCLEAEGMTVVEAANGPETLDVFVRERPDLVFLDVEMPGMSGLEVCKRIRQMPGASLFPS